MSEKADPFCCVEDNLYLGSYGSICLLQEPAADLPVFQPEATDGGNGTVLEISKIPSPFHLAETAILTLDTHCLPDKFSARCGSYKFVNVEDSLHNELIRCFDDCFAFIAESRKRGAKVLVHCNAGVSRSATIVAMYLMREHGIGVDEALGIIRRSRQQISPNSHFLEQLHLYRAMSYRLDPSHSAYRQWRLRLLTQSGFPQYDVDSLLVEGPQHGDSCSELYCCRICRCPLFSSKNLLTHPVSTREMDSKSELANSVSPLCTQKELFVEPVVWMRDEIMQLEGKLNCPKCKKKIGAFSWIGQKCLCGLFVAPSFHFDKGKVEVRKGIYVSSGSN